MVTQPGFVMEIIVSVFQPFQLQQCLIVDCVGTVVFIIAEVPFYDGIASGTIRCNMNAISVSSIQPDTFIIFCYIQLVIFDTIVT